MSKKYNEKFLKLYDENDKACCEKFGVEEGGLVEYINRLNNAKFAPNRDEVLPRLVKYKNLKGNFDNSPVLVRKGNEVAKEDLKWIESFTKDVEKKKDPVSLYLRKARNFARRRKARNVFLVILVLALIAGAAAAAIFLL